PHGVIQPAQLALGTAVHIAHASHHRVRLIVEIQAVRDELFQFDIGRAFERTSPARPRTFATEATAVVAPPLPPRTAPASPAAPPGAPSAPPAPRPGGAAVPPAVPPPVAADDPRVVADAGPPSFAEQVALRAPHSPLAARPRPRSRAPALVRARLPARLLLR